MTISQAYEIMCREPVILSRMAGYLTKGDLEEIRDPLIRQELFTLKQEGEKSFYMRLIKEIKEQFIGLPEDLKTELDRVDLGEISAAKTFEELALATDRMASFLLSRLGIPPQRKAGYRDLLSCLRAFGDFHSPFSMLTPSKGEGVLEKLCWAEEHFKSFSEHRVIEGPEKTGSPPFLVDQNLRIAIAFQGIAFYLLHQKTLGRIPREVRGEVEQITRSDSFSGAHPAKKAQMVAVLCPITVLGGAEEVGAQMVREIQGEEEKSKVLQATLFHIWNLCELPLREEKITSFLQEVRGDYQGERLGGEFMRAAMSGGKSAQEGILLASPASDQQRVQVASSALWYTRFNTRDEGWRSGHDQCPELAFFRLIEEIEDPTKREDAILHLAHNSHLFLYKEKDLLRLILSIENREKRDRAILAFLEARVLFYSPEFGSVRGYQRLIFRDKDLYSILALISNGRLLNRVAERFGVYFDAVLERGIDLSEVEKIEAELSGGLRIFSEGQGEAADLIKSAYIESFFRRVVQYYREQGSFNLDRQRSNPLPNRGQAPARRRPPALLTPISTSAIFDVLNNPHYSACYERVLEFARTLKSPELLERALRVIISNRDSVPERLTRVVEGLSRLVREEENLSNAGPSTS